MKKQEIQKIKGKTEILLGMRMVDMERWDDSMLCGFIPANKDEEIIQQELRMIERIDFDYRIATHGVFRWTYKDRVILAYQDIFQPSIAILDDNRLGIRGGMKLRTLTSMSGAITVLMKSMNRISNRSISKQRVLL